MLIPFKEIIHGGRKKAEIVGITKEGCLVISGRQVFQFVDSLGLPLEIILERFKNENIIVEWQAFYNQATKVGWKRETVITMIRNALSDIYDKSYTEEVLKRIKQ